MNTQHHPNEYNIDDELLKKHAIIAVQIIDARYNIIDFSNFLDKKK